MCCITASWCKREKRCLAEHDAQEVAAPESQGEGGDAVRKPFKLEVTKEWIERMSKLEEGYEVGAGNWPLPGAAAPSEDPTMHVRLTDVRLIANYAMSMAEGDVENAAIRVTLALDGGIEQLKATAKPLSAIDAEIALRERERERTDGH